MVSSRKDSGVSVGSSVRTSEERAERPRLESGPRRGAGMSIVARDWSTLVRGVEHPDPSAERLVGVLERLDGELRVGPRDEDRCRTARRAPRRRGTSARSRRGRRRPGPWSRATRPRRSRASVRALRLAGVEPARPVEAPGDLRGEQKPGRPRPAPGPARPSACPDAEGAPSGDRHRREGQEEDEVPGLERDAGAGARRAKQGDDGDARDAAVRTADSGRVRARTTRPSAARSAAGAATAGQPATKSPNTSQRYSRTSNGDPSSELDSPDARRRSARRARVRPPERGREHEHGAEREERRAQRQRPPGPEHGDVDDLCGEHEDAVWLGREKRERRRRPGRPATPAFRARAHGAGGGARARCEEEEAVHPRVDAVVERRPARGGEQRREERRPPIASAGRRAPRSRACSRRRRRPRSAGGSSGPGRRRPDEVREEVVERRAAALAEDGLEHVAERLSG